MTVSVFPTVNDVGNPGSGKTLKELNLIAWLKQLIAQNFVVSGFTVPASSANLTLSVALGQACIDGRRVDIDTATNVTCAASTTNHIYLKLTKDASQNVIGAVFEVNTTGVAPADSVKIATAVASGTAVTSTTDARVLYPFAYSQMPYTPVNKAGDRISGTLEFTDATRRVKTPGASLSIENAGGASILSAVGYIYMSANCYDDGTNWNRYDTGQAAAMLVVNQTAGKVYFYSAAAGANPISWGAPVEFVNKAGDAMTGKLSRAVGTLGTTAGDTLELDEVLGSEGGNAVKSIIRLRRTANGTGWATIAIDILRRTDATDQGYITLHPDGTLQYNGNTVYHAGNKSDIIASGTYSDTTTSIAANSTYTLNIPIGSGKNRATTSWKGSTSDVGGIVYCSTNNLETLSHLVRNTGPSTVHRNSSAYLSAAGELGVQIYLTECYISGTNLVLVFKNSDTVANTLNLPKLHWMAA